MILEATAPHLRKEPFQLMRRLMVVYLTVFALPLVSACSGAAAPAAPSTNGQITLTALDTMKFNPGGISVKAGQPVQLTLDNQGKVVHDVRIEGPAQPVAIEVKPSAKGTATFSIDQPGTYAFYCSQPGHREAGMKGTLTVQ
jgi:uncharacterized cupredoxin-like copper-binding protein